VTDPLEEEARKLSAADWIGPAPADDWNRLTLGEQQRYCRQACRTKGAVYSTHISAARISVSVDLPRELQFLRLSKDEAERMERSLHNKIEDWLVWELRAHPQPGPSQ
jgi:hypothetical protein